MASGNLWWSMIQTNILELEAHIQIFVNYDDTQVIDVVVVVVFEHKLNKLPKIETSNMSHGNDP